MDGGGDTTENWGRGGERKGRKKKIFFFFFSLLLSRHDRFSRLNQKAFFFAFSCHQHFTPLISTLKPSILLPFLSPRLRSTPLPTDFSSWLFDEKKKKKHFMEFFAASVSIFLFLPSFLFSSSHSSSSSSSFGKKLNVFNFHFFFYFYLCNFIWRGKTTANREIISQFFFKSFFFSIS